MMELVTGGSGSGKSAYAEEKICTLYKEYCKAEANGQKKLHYIATMYPYGRETKEKIADHRRRREGKGFRTLEWYTNIAEKIRQFEASGEALGCVLLECVSNLTANELYMEEGAKDETVRAVAEAAAMLKKKSRHLVVVTNEIFSESAKDSEEMRKYKYIMGEINKEIAKMADEVTEVVCGRPIKRKAEITENENPGKEAVKDELPCGETKSQMKNETIKEIKSTAKSEGKNETKREVKNGIRIVTGGAFQGKRSYAQLCYPGLKWSSGADCGFEEITTWEAVDQFHLFIRRWLESGRKKEKLLEMIGGERNLVIVCDEIGCGLVPVDAFEREYREAVGRIMTELTAKAVRADRVICGIGSVIK